MEKEEKRKKQGKSRYKKMLFLPAVLLAITAAIAVGIFFYGGLHTGTSKGYMEYCLQEDGTLQISWQAEADKSVVYRLSRYDEAAGDYVFCGEYTGGGATLTDVEPGRELNLKMQRVRNISLFGHNREIAGAPDILTVVPLLLDSPALRKTADVGNKSVKITWDADPENRYQIFLMNEEGTLELIAETEDGGITFTPENRDELAGREKVLGIAVRAVRRMDGYVLKGGLSNMTIVKRADLMEDDINLAYTDNGGRQYTLSWQEGKGDWYELQEWSWSEKEWISRQVYAWSDALSYETEKLPSCTEMRFRVITYNDAELRDKETFAAEPSEVSFRTERSPVYCTIWPLTALNISEDAAGKNITGKVPAGQALCVLEETAGRFYVRYGDTYGYIDSDYCLINLPEYMGNLCKYNITNSYSSIFRVHGYYIPEVTDTVIKGYENIRMEDGETLVPYLYPCSQKLYEAAVRAEQDGYRLCIYDAFRPNEATRYLYDTVEVLLDTPVLEEDPEETEGGPEEETEREPIDPAELTAIVNTEEKITVLVEGLDPAALGIIRKMSSETLEAFYMLPQEILADESLLTPEILADMGLLQPETETEAEPDETAAEQDETAAEPDETAAAEQTALTAEDIALLQGIPAEDIPALKALTWEELEALKIHLDNLLSYWQVMTEGGRFRLGSFLAQTVSTHNRGIALDLTLVDGMSDEDLEMQTDMHDLSWYSILAQNNGNADLLASYMKGVGYNDLSSEWWHFQDDETRYRLNLGYLEKGLSPEGWRKDDRGWRYRREDGSYCRAETTMIDKKEYTFDEEGYLVGE